MPFFRLLLTAPAIRKSLLCALALFFFFSPLLAQRPVINGFSPVSGPAGTTVTITGTNFATSLASLSVYFGASKATILSATSTTIAVKVPAGASYQPISLTSNKLVAYSARPFALTFTGGGNTVSSHYISAPTRITTPRNPRALVLTDFDGDSKPDMAVTDYNNVGIKTYNNTTITGQSAVFLEGFGSTVGERPSHLVVGDIDMDGRPDLAVVNQAANSVTILKNRNATGPSAVWLSVPTGPNPAAVAIGDLNADGRPDLAVVNTDSNSVSLHMNTTSPFGELAFAPRINLPTGSYPRFVAITDIDGDNKPDVVVANAGSNNVSVFRNTLTAEGGAMEFAAPVSFAAGSKPVHISVGDLDGDNRPDIVVTNGSGPAVSLLQNSSAPNNIAFTVPTAIGPGTNTVPFSTTLGDLNGDGLVDLALSYDSVLNNHIALFTNTSANGHIGFNAGSIIKGPSTASFLQIADLNGDARPDLAAGSVNGNAIFYYHNQAGIPYINSFSPAIGGSGSTITIRGRNLANATAVSLGGVAATSFNIVSDSVVTAVVAGGATGEVQLIAPEGEANLAGYTFYARPVIASFAPTATGKGATVVIKGSNLRYVTGVSFGGVHASQFTPTADSIVAQVGEGASGRVVVTGYGGADSLAGFEFIAPPTISSFAPAAAGVGETITIRGQGLKTAVEVLIGGRKATITGALTDTLITVSTTGPSGAVSVRTAGGMASKTGFVFTNVVVTSVSPKILGPGSLITIKGENFSQVNSVMLGSYQAASYTIVSDTVMTVVAGPEVELPGKLFTNAGIFMFHFSGISTGRPVIHTISPLSGPVGTTVTITGIQFDPVAANNLVYLGAVRAPVTGATANQLTITVPPGASYDPVTVTVGNLTDRSLQMFNTTFTGTDTLSANTLAAPLKLTLAGASESVRLMDIDGDGKSDITQVNAMGIHSISIFKNNSITDSLGFAPVMNFATGDWPSELDLGDLDGDGKPDIAVAVRGNGIQSWLSIFRNTSTPGTVSLASRWDLSTIAGANGIAIVDVTADGKPDIVITSPGSSVVSVHRNVSIPGNLGFEPRVDFAVGVEPSAITGGDLDGDGLNDIAVSNYTAQTITLFRNKTSTGNIAFDTTRIAAPANIRSLLLTDLDGDGRPELTAAAYNSRYAATILKNNSVPGLMSFAAPATFGNYLSAVGFYCVMAGDINGDGKPDLAVANQTMHELILLRNTSAGGNIAFGQSISFTKGVDNSYAVAIGDLDGDHRPDVVVGNPMAYGMLVYRNLSGHPIPTINSFTPGTAGAGDTVSIRGILLGGTKEVSFGGIITTPVEIAGDTLVKAVVPVSAASGTLRIITESGFAEATGFVFLGPTILTALPQAGSTGSLVTITGKRFTGATGVWFGTAPAASFEVVSDTVIKAVVGTGATGPFKVQTPKGQFATPHNFIYTTQLSIVYFTPAKAAVGQTVTITGTRFYPHADSVVVYFGNARASVTSATVSEITAIVPAGATSSLISVTSQGRTVYSKLFFNKLFPGGAVAFTPSSFDSAIRVQTGGKPLAAALADLDGDGKPDVALIHERSAHALEVYRNHSTPGTISLLPTQALASKPMLSDIAIADLDGDGKLDIAVTSIGSNGFSIYRNNSTIGNIAFAAPVDYSTDFGTTMIRVADFDGDGLTDILVHVPNPGNTYIYRNNSTKGQLSFAQASFINFGAKPLDIAVIDMNYDGKPDVMGTTDLLSNSVVSHRNVSVPGGTINFVNTNSPTPVKPWPARIMLNEFGGDAMPDLAIIHNSNGLLSMIRGLAPPGSTTITFSSTIDMPVAGPGDLAGLALEDLNGDGKADVVTTRAVGKTILIHKNTNILGSLHGFAPAVEYAIGQSASNVYAADLDGDGQSDLLTTNPEDGSLSLLRNTVVTAGIVASGAHPVTGRIENKVTIEPEVPELNGTPFVARYYDLAATGSQPGATATVTFFFTQEEFDQFNSHPDGKADLPASADDAAGKANLRIYQYLPAGGNRVGNALADSVKVINPDDARIVWNETAGCWQVTVEVEGLNRFIVSTVGFVYALVPGPLVTVTGGTEFCEGASSLLSSSATANNQWYRNGVAIDGATNTTYQASLPGEYTVTTMVTELRTLPSAGTIIKVKAVPGKPVITGMGAELVSDAAAGNQWYREGVVIAGATAQVYKPTDAANYSVTVTLNGCTSVQSANFYFATTGIINIDNVQYVSLNPNPVSDFLLLNFHLNGASKLQVRLVDLQGKVSRSFANLSHGARLYLGNLVPGIYLARISDGSGKRQYTLKVVKL